MAFDAALRAPHALPGDAPQQPLAFVAVCRRGGSPDLKVMRRGAGYGVDESLQGLLINVTLLQVDEKTGNSRYQLSCNAL